MEASAILDSPNHAPTTRAAQCGTLRNLLRWLWEECGAPKLDRHVKTHPAIRPRNVKATRAEIDLLLSQANPTIRLWILLCSDLAIRSGTAVQISPEHYDQERRELTFTSKKDSKVSLPVTEELAAIFDSCNLCCSIPFMTQIRERTRRKSGAHPLGRILDTGPLRHEFKMLRQKVGIERKLVLHDLRRTAAVRLYRLTRNIRLVQSFLGHAGLPSTIWYLDNDLEPVEVLDLEAIKKPFIVPRTEKIA
jgi:integrase